MALIALDKCMRPHQRESIVVVLDRLDVDLPALDCVAALAIGAKLATVNVCMTLGALRACLFEDQVRVALRAGNLRVHPAQRIAGRVVIELRVRPYRLPAHVRMAVLARNGNWAVWIGHFCLRAADLRLCAVGRHMRLQSSQRGCHSNRDCKYPPKPIQRVSPQSLRGARQDVCKPLYECDLRNQPIQ